MAKVKVKMSRAGAQAVLKSAGVVADLKSRAEAIAHSACAQTSPDPLASDPFMAKSEVDEVGARAVAFSATPHGHRASNKHDVLLKSIGAGR